MRQPSPPRTSGSNSIMRPARRSAFWRRSARRVGVVAQHPHHVARLQHRADAAADRLAAVGDHHVEVQPEPRRPRTRTACFSRCASGMQRTLAVGPTGMSSTRCVEPAAIFFDRIEATICPGESMRQRPLHRDQDVVGRATGRRVPPQARQPRCSRTICCQPLEGQLDLGQHLHRVGGAGRRGDRARRGLRAQHAVRGDDGHHQHRGAVAGDAADAVLVDHRAAAHLVLPVEPAAGGDHGLGQVQHLVAVELELVGGHDEGRQLDLRVARLAPCRA